MLRFRKEELQAVAGVRVDRPTNRSRVHREEALLLVLRCFAFPLTSKQNVSELSRCFNTVVDHIFQEHGYRVSAYLHF
jgi:hypothetical protein